jgi:hypothetical protein
MLLKMCYFKYLDPVIDFRIYRKLPSFHCVFFIKISTFMACIYLLFHIIQFHIISNFLDTYFFSCLIINLYPAFYLIYQLLILGMFQCFQIYLFQQGCEWRNHRNLFKHLPFFLNLETVRANLAFPGHLLHCKLWVRFFKENFQFSI